MTRLENMPSIDLTDNKQNLRCGFARRTLRSLIVTRQQTIITKYWRSVI